MITSKGIFKAAHSKFQFKESELERKELYIEQHGKLSFIAFHQKMSPVNVKFNFTQNNNDKMNTWSGGPPNSWDDTEYSK